jgi:nuclear inhibitor of protein phosphatase 1
LCFRRLRVKILTINYFPGDKLIEKLLIDEKKYYLFGRNADMCDFLAGHASCSRAHAALMYHSKLKRAFIVDLKSAHGTYLGTKRLEPHLPTQLPTDVQVIHFKYINVYLIWGGRKKSK